MKDENTAMMKLADLLKQHEVVMEKCPEIIEIIEDLYVQIERQQIIEAYYTGADEESDRHGAMYQTKEDAQHYYYSTYG